MAAVPEHISDATLIAAVRMGDSKAYGLLYERHLPAANRAASYLAGTAAEREDLVAEAFTRVLQVLRTGRGPSHDFRPYLLVTMRHAAINAARRSPSTALFADLPDAYLRDALDDPVDARLTGNDAANAFAELPERWRKVLWHTEIVGSSPAAIAPMMGMTPNGVAALAYRAREGLRQAYLRMHLPAVDRRDCREATDKLAGWVRRNVSEPQHRKISAHLSRCSRCRELAAGLREVNGDLQAVSPLMSWLSVLKGALSATSVKLGAAAAIAAVTAVGIVASDPTTPPGDVPDSALAPVLPNTQRNAAETNIHTSGAPELVSDDQPLPPPQADGGTPENEKPKNAGGSAANPQGNAYGAGNTGPQSIVKPDKSPKNPKAAKPAKPENSKPGTPPSQANKK